MEEDPWANNILSRITLHSEGAAHVRLVRAAWNAVHTIHPTCLSQRNNTIPRTEGGENVFSTDTARSYLVLGHHQHVSGNKEKTWGVISLTSASCSLTFLFFLPPDLYWKCKCQPYVLRVPLCFQNTLLRGKWRLTTFSIGERPLGPTQSLHVKAVNAFEDALLPDMP